MELIYNETLIDSAELKIGQFDRAFRYGDGLFETIIARNGKIQLLDYHFQRLALGLDVLSIQLPNLGIGYLEDNLKKFLEANQLKGDSRIKVHVWRKEGGLYTPSDNLGNILISGTSFNKEQKRKIKAVGISQCIRLHLSPYSSFKTCNAIPYIIAGQEKEQRKLDEIIILDYRGYLSECSSSNLFWMKGGTVYTPALSTGCIAGIMRRNILEQSKKNGIFTKEVEEKPETLKSAEQIFCCNVTGIYSFEAFEGRKLDMQGLSFKLALSLA